MYPYGEHIWQEYYKGIYAFERRQAACLLHYLKFLQISRAYLQAMEFVDLNRCRVVRRKKKVSKLLFGPRAGQRPFVFPLMLN